MSRKITPSQVSAQFNYNIFEATEFAANLLEDVNDHNVALALHALNAEDYTLACEFIKLEQTQAAVGELTPALQRRRMELIERLKESKREAESDT